MKEIHSTEGAPHIAQVAMCGIAVPALCPKVAPRGWALTWGRGVLALLLLAGSGIAAAQTGRPQAPPPAAGPYRIAGTVANAKTGAPLAHASVQIQDARNLQSTRTVTADNDGHFEFRVMAGKFGLLGAKHGFITSYYNAHEMYSSAVVTGVGLDTEHLILRLPPDAVLSGKVLDESGEPVRDAQVRVYREEHSSGIGRIVSVDTTATDDQGAYEATPLNAGTYFVAVHANPWYAVHPLTGRDTSTVDRSLDVAYPITYYGDVTQSDEATPIPVRGGDHLEADIHLSPVAAVHLTFHADEERGTSLEVRAPTFDGFEEIRSTNLQMVSPGVYEVNGLAPGQYQVRLPDASGNLKEPKEMDITGGQELDNSSARPVSAIKAAAHMRDGTKLPEDLSLALRSSQNNRLIAWERVNDQGQAEFSDVSPGRYNLLASTSERAYAVDSISSGEARSTGKTLDVPAGASLEISVSVVGGMSNVEGLAKRAGKPAPGAMIVLVPVNPEATRERFRRDQSDLDGTFNLQNVIPGAYTVIAIEDGWDLDWAKPAVLAPYLPKGQPVKVSDKTQGPIHLSSPVEVQKK